MIDWEPLLSDLRGDDIELALAASETIAAGVTPADLPRVYVLARDDDYFVRVMAGDILAKTAGISALQVLLQIMLRNEAEGYENDGLDTVIKAMIDANPITARATLQLLGREGDDRARALARWGLEGVPEETTVVTPLVTPPAGRERRGCLLHAGLLVVGMLTLGAWVGAALTTEDEPGKAEPATRTGRRTQGVSSG
jgi:hypothetical protein